MVAIVAAVGVDVVPVADKFAARLVSKLLPQASKVGDALGKSMGQPIAEGVTDGVEKGVKQGNTAAQGAKAGTDFGGAFARTVKTRLEAALKDLPNAQIDADSTPAQREVAAIRTELASLRDAKLGVDLDADDALASIYVLQARLMRLQAESAEVEVTLDAGAALAQILLLRRELSKLDGQNVRFDIKGDGVSGVQSGLAAVTGSLGLVSAESATSNLSIIGLGSAGAALAPAIVPAATAAAAAVAMIANAGLAAGAALGVAVLAFSGISDAVGALDKAAKEGGKSTQDLFNKQLAIADASQSIARAERGVNSVRVENARNLERAMRSVSDAEQNLANLRIENARSLERAEQSVADAQDALIDARRRVADAEEGVVAARDRVSQADYAILAAQQRVIDSHDALVRSIEDVGFAEDDLVRAQEDAKRTQEDLTEARKDAARQLEDYENRVKSGAIDEEQARLRVTQALQRYREELVDRKASAADREEALLAYRESIQQYDELKLANKRLAEDKAAADAKGIEGSDQVVAAQDRIVASQDAVVAAQRRLADAQRTAQAAQRSYEEAQRGVTTATKDAAAARKAVADAELAVADARKGVVEAQRDVAEASRNVGDVQRTNAQRLAAGQREIRDATQNVGDVQRANAERMIAATEAVTSAQRQLARAMHDTGTTGSSALAKVAETMAELSPAGQAFARFIQDELKPVFFDLRNTAQSALLPLLTTALKSMAPLLPVFRLLIKNVGTALGELLIQAAKTFTSPFWIQFFTFLATTIGPNLQWLGRVGLAVAKMFAILFMAFEPVGRTMGTQLADIAEQAAVFLAAWVKSDSFTEFVAYMLASAPLMGELLLALAKALLALMIAFAPLGPVILRAITAFANFIAAMDPKLLLYSVMLLTAALASLALGIGAVGLFIPLAVAAFSSLAALFARVYHESAIFRAIVDTTVKVTGAVFMWLWKFVIRPVGIGIGAALMACWLVVKFVFNILKWTIEKIVAPVMWWLFRNVTKPALGGMQLIFQIFWSVIKVIFGLIVAALLLVGKGFQWLYQRFVRPYLQETGKEIATVWRNNIRPVLNTLADIWKQKIVPAWRSAIDGIRRMWGTLRQWAKVPIDFFVRTIINKGLIGGYNKMVSPISKSLMIDPIKPWPPSGWARGGVLPQAYDGAIVPGYTPGRDTHLALVGGGEGILRPEVARVIGADRINAWNYNARIGRSGPQLLGAYASGGLVGSGPGTFPFMKKWLAQNFPAARAMTYQPSFGYHRGNPANSYAADIFAPNMVQVALAIKKAFKPKIKELIHTPLEGAQVWNGKDYTFSGAALRSAHYNHIHWAMLQGGQGAGSGFFDFLGKLGRALASPLTSGMKSITNMLHGDTPIAKLLAAMGKRLVGGLVQKGKDAAEKFLSFFMDEGPGSMTGARNPSAKAAQDYARTQLKRFSWPSSQMSPLIALWNGESGWNYKATNKSSGAYGIPQALPAGKMASAGPDWRTNPKTQINWGMKYIADRYGTPMTAYNQWQARSPHWYDTGGYLPQGLSLAMNGTGQRERILDPAQTRAYDNGRDGSMTLRVIVEDGQVSGLIRVEVDEALGALADAHVYGGVG